MNRTSTLVYPPWIIYWYLNIVYIFLGLSHLPPTVGKVSSGLSIYDPDSTTLNVVWRFI